MTARTNVSAGVFVAGLDDTDTTVARARVGHGQHPETLLAQAGWRTELPLFATVLGSGALELGYRVSQLSDRPATHAGSEGGPTPTRRDPGVGDATVGEPHQRVAAYAVATSERGLLLTQFNSLTAVPGKWGLPGGGLDEGESPLDGVHREVWEETGQRVVLDRLATIQSQHWVGRAPSGVVEDYHAVRIVYRATCPDPVDPVVHDEGGTTADARWVPLYELERYPMTSSWRGLALLV